MSQDNMAYFDQRQKKIILEEEDKKILKEALINLQNKKTPVTDSIMKNITGNGWATPKALTMEDLAD